MSQAEHVAHFVRRYESNLLSEGNASPTVGLHRAAEDAAHSLIVEAARGNTIRYTEPLVARRSTADQDGTHQQVRPATASRRPCLRIALNHLRPKRPDDTSQRRHDDRAVSDGHSLREVEHDQVSGRQVPCLKLLNGWLHGSAPQYQTSQTSPFQPTDTTSTGASFAIKLTQVSRLDRKLKTT